MSTCYATILNYNYLNITKFFIHDANLVRETH